VQFGILLVVLVAELLSVTARYEVPEHAPWLFQLSKQAWQIALWMAGCCFLLLTPKLDSVADDLRHDLRDHPWLHWLGLHSIAFLAFVVVTALIFDRPTNATQLSVVWFVAWFALAGITLLLWLFAVAPGRSWLRLLRQHRARLLTGSLLGIGAWMLIGMLVRQEAPLGQTGLWTTLSGTTLRMVYALLSLVYGDLVYEPDKLLVGTDSFPVEVTYACSGIEGISLISGFLAIYLWLFRRELRFPQCLWLFPLGLAAAYLGNAVRIALLIAIGTSVSPELALQGFHAQAGWVAFTLIAVGAIALSHRMRFFSLPRSGDRRALESHRLAVALLAPLLVLLAISMVSATVFIGVDWFYPLGVLATGIVLWHFRNSYRGLGWTWSWQALALGVGVFAIWMFLEPPPTPSHGPLAEAGFVATLWIVFRVLGSTITVPLAEELAFRGYLMRKLVKGNFESVPLTQFTWLSFAASSILFGLLHGRWLAGTIAGMAYALAVYRRGQLGDAVVAHATTNALIAIWVIAGGNWHLWSRIGT
jgi:exosortase E/protease (VPEID-CTERM system)